MSSILHGQVILTVDASDIVFIGALSVCEQG